MAKSEQFEAIENLIRTFSEVRDWDQFHTPKNLVLAATTELGELAELFLWKTDQEVETFLQSQEGKQQISEEIADVAIYLMRLCQKTEIDFIEAIRSKIAINEVKYPIEKSKGNSQKYNKFIQS
jgi:NTP pyrophosphatase (non-canonical NTP hydrolase)